MKQWGKSWFYRITFFTAILMLIAGIFYLFRKLILAGSGQFVSYDVTQEGQTASLVEKNNSKEVLSERTSDTSAGSAADRVSDEPAFSDVPEPDDVPALSEPAEPDNVTAHSEPAGPDDIPAPSEPAGPDDIPAPSEPAGPDDIPAPSEPAGPDDIPAPSEPAGPRVLDPERPIVALTFDDGPGQGTTAILDLLEQYDARATFFVIGLCLEQPVQTEKLQRAFYLGCAIGSHTYDHISFRELDAEQIRSQTERVNEQLMQYTGFPADLVRPPYGHITDEARKAAETPYIHWSIDTEDWLSRDAQAIVAMVQENVQDGDIILMHDIYPSTAEACETLIPWLIEQGYQLATVPEMMEARGIAMENGHMYKDAR